MTNLPLLNWSSSWRREVVDTGPSNGGGGPRFQPGLFTDVICARCRTSFDSQELLHGENTEVCPVCGLANKITLIEERSERPKAKTHFTDYLLTAIDWLVSRGSRSRKGW